MDVFPVLINHIVKIVSQATFSIQLIIIVNYVVVYKDVFSVTLPNVYYAKQITIYKMVYAYIFHTIHHY